MQTQFILFFIFFPRTALRAVRGGKNKINWVCFFSSWSYEMKTIAYTDRLVIQIYRLS